MVLDQKTIDELRKYVKPLPEDDWLQEPDTAVFIPPQVHNYVLTGGLLKSDNAKAKTTKTSRNRDMTTFFK